MLSPLTVSCDALCTSGGQFRVRFCQRFRWTEAGGNGVIGGSKENIAPTAENAVPTDGTVLFGMLLRSEKRLFQRVVLYSLW